MHHFLFAVLIIQKGKVAGKLICTVKQYGTESSLVQFVLSYAHMYNQIHKEVDNVRKEQAKAMELIFAYPSKSLQFQTLPKHIANA